MMNRTSMAAALLVAVAACAQTDQTSIPPDALTTGESFVPIEKPGTPSIAAHRSALGAYANPLSSPGKDFYLAISKKELGERWFLSGYLKDLYPENVGLGAARSLGTRVVTFRVQNDKLFIFDVADNKKTSDTFDPTVIVEAYPLVHGYGPFESLANANEYVLFDPSAGLNKFAAGADNFYDFYLGTADAAEFRVGISFMQNFRKISDGATYQQIFTGTSTIATATGPFEFRASGTLGISLRKYKEGDGFAPTVAPPVEHFFQSDWKLIPNTGGADYSAMHWNFRPGMKPVTFLITRDILEIQKQHPGVDVVGAIQKGVTNWNEAFGYKALEARVADEKDDFSEDDKNFIVIDRSPAAGYAFANWRLNPNTGEVRGATVYIGGVWFDNYFEDDADEPVNPDELKKDRPAPTLEKRPVIDFAPLAAKPLCILEAPAMRDVPRFRVANLDAGSANMPANEKFEKFLTHLVLHEVGHTLGLRHNFAGSLANNSVMDYLNDADSIARSVPGEYDHQAIKYLYQMEEALPETAFCTDGDYYYDPDCQMFDSGADPLASEWTPNYVEFRDFVLEIGWGFGLLDYIVEYYLDGVLMYVRGAGDPAVALKAYETAMGPARAPLSAESLAVEGFGDAADGLARLVLRKLYLDPPELRGMIIDDPSAPPVVAAVMTDVRNILTNVDKVRSFATRRMMVDILKSFQNAESYAILREAKAAILAAKSLGGMTAAEAANTDDLLARIDRAISPYYE